MKPVNQHQIPIVGQALLEDIQDWAVGGYRHIFRVSFGKALDGRHFALFEPRGMLELGLPAELPSKVFWFNRKWEAENTFTSLIDLVTCGLPESAVVDAIYTPGAAI